MAKVSKKKAAKKTVAAPKKDLKTKVARGSEMQRFAQAFSRRQDERYGKN